MKFSFFKVATMLSLCTFFALTSCDKSEIERENNELQASSQIQSEYDALEEMMAKDTNVIEYAYVDLSKVNDALRRESDRFDTYKAGYGPWFVYDLKGWVSSKNNAPSTKLINGITYYKLDVDLNMEAGGDYVYLYYALTADEKKGIGAIDGYYNSTSYYGGTSVVQCCNKSGDLNCNSGTRGGNIRLGMRHVDNTAFYGILVAAYKTSANGYIAGGWHRVASDLDLNKGAKGRFIYIFTKKLEWKD